MLTAAFLTKWLWDYNRERREERAELEPRANPPLHATYASKAECVLHNARVEHLEQKVDANYKDLDAKRSMSVANLHEKFEEQTRELNARIDAIPARTISLLRETKNLL